MDTPIIDWNGDGVIAAYSHDFETAYREIEAGCKVLLKHVTK